MVATRRRKAGEKAAEARQLSNAQDQVGNGTTSGYDNGEPQLTLDILSPTIDVPDLLEPGPPPRYTIDLSLPPRERYAALATAYKHKLIQLPVLFDDVLIQLQSQNPILRPWPIKQLARLLLRRIHNCEQMEELIGIQEATGIPMYLLVAFNLLLDMFVSCTSGGVRVMDKANSVSQGTYEKKMLHFRTLDWAMDPLRQIVRGTKFRCLPWRSDCCTLNHAPWICWRLGWREMLSRWKKMQYLGGKALVLLGRRPSIPCTLSRYVIPGARRVDDGSYLIVGHTLPCLEEVTDTFPDMPTAQCFVIVSDGNKTTVIEKGWKTAVLRADSLFIVCTNHDQADEGGESASSTPAAPHRTEETKENIPNSAAVAGMDQILEESVDRKHNIERKWNRAKDSYLKKNPGSNESDVAVPFVTVKWWLTHQRICADCTHFMVVMDP